MSEIDTQENAQNTEAQDEVQGAANAEDMSENSAESCENNNTEAVNADAENDNVDSAEEASSEEAIEPEIVTDEEIEAEKAQSNQAEESVDQKPEKEAKKDETDWKDAYIRLAADFDNYRKRTSKEQDDIRKRERERVIKAWLEVYDNTERAIFSLPEKEGPWFEGFSSLIKQMDKCLATFNIKPADDLGKPFDPKKHEAIQTLPNPAMENGTIMHVESRGFVYENGDVARIARVIVVKNPS